MFLRVAVAQVEQHYKSGVYVLRVYGAVFFGACDGDVIERVCEGGAPCVLPQH
jgi:hypothetical protein